MGLILGGITPPLFLVRLLSSPLSSHPPIDPPTHLLTHRRDSSLSLILLLTHPPTHPIKTRHGKSPPQLLYQRGPSGPSSHPPTHPPKPTHPPPNPSTKALPPTHLQAHPPTHPPTTAPLLCTGNQGRCVRQTIHVAKSGKPPPPPPHPPPSTHPPTYSQAYSSAFEPSRSPLPT